MKTSLLSLDLSLLSPSHRPFYLYSSLYSHIFLYTLSYLYQKIEEFKGCSQDIALKKLVSGLENLMSFMVFLCLFWNKEVIGVRLVANMIGARSQPRPGQPQGTSQIGVGALVYKVMIRDLDICGVEDIEERGEQLLKSKYGSDLLALTQTQLQTKKIKKLISHSVHLNFSAYSHRYLDIISQGNSEISVKMIKLLTQKKNIYHSYIKKIY